MPFDRNQFIEDLKGSYEMYYDLLPEEENGEIPLAFRADFHSRGEKYFLIKPAKIWSNETNEYVFVYSAPWFDSEMIDRCVQFALDTALHLHGFTLLKAGWIDLQGSAYGTNRDGHDMNKFFKELFADRH